MTASGATRIATSSVSATSLMSDVTIGASSAREVPSLIPTTSTPLWHSTAPARSPACVPPEPVQKTIASTTAPMVVVWPSISM